MVFSGLARLGNDPVARSTPDGRAVMDLSLAFDYGKRGPDGKRPTQWITGTMWGERVEKLAQHLVKGQKLFVTLTDLHTETYKRNDGTEGVSLRGRLGELEFAGEAKNKIEEAPKAPPTKGFADLDDDIPY